MFATQNNTSGHGEIVVVVQPTEPNAYAKLRELADLCDKWNEPTYVGDNLREFAKHLPK